MNFAELTALFRKFLPPDDRPVVAYSGLFAIARELPPPLAPLPARVLESLLEAVGTERTFLMPTYTQGFRNGFIDLDSTPCNTGMVNELFRCLPDSRRTRSAFFSFAARGPEAAELVALQPVDAWGEGSVFEWILQRDAHIVMIGVPWSMCSFLHIAEWEARVPYRYRKTFSGGCMHERTTLPLVETLFVRSLDPVVENTWPGLDELLLQRGMARVSLGRSQVATASAGAIRNAVLPSLRRDPFAFVNQRDAIRSAFEALNSQSPA